VVPQQAAVLEHSVEEEEQALVPALVQVAVTLRSLPVVLPRKQQAAEEQALVRIWEQMQQRQDSSNSKEAVFQVVAADQREERVQAEHLQIHLAAQPAHR
jgi:hypothetical protein